MRKRLNEELGRKTVEEFRMAGKSQFSLLLDNVRSHNNIGSVFRTADAFLVEKIYLCGITAAPPHRDITKTALGATESVMWEYHKSAFETALKLKEAGYRVISVEQAEGAKQLLDFEVKKDERYVLVFGHEIKGVGQEVVDISDDCIEIPQFGTKHSFNIAVSAGIVLWELSRGLTPLQPAGRSGRQDHARGKGPEKG